MDQASAAERTEKGDLRADWDGRRTWDWFLACEADRAQSYKALSLSSPLPSICYRPEKRRVEKDTGTGQGIDGDCLFMSFHKISELGESLKTLSLTTPDSRWRGQGEKGRA